MPVFKTVDGLKFETEVTDVTSNTIMFAEKYAVEAVPAGTRLFVGGLSMNTSDSGPVVDDQVLVGFEHGEKGPHPDFLWAPDWIL